MNVEGQGVWKNTERVASIAFPHIPLGTDPMIK